jgi:hypothetical protein
MEKRFNEFKQKIDRKLNAMDAKIAFMNENLSGLRADVKDFKGDFDDFIDFTHEYYQDHEKRIASLEKKNS